MRSPTSRDAVAQARGFTILELIVVIAIVGVLAALSLAALSRINTRVAPQNAAYEFSSMLSKARSRALQRNSDVWLVVYPNLTRTGGKGKGAFFIFEDPDGDFGTHYAGLAFDPLADSLPGRVRRIESIFLEDLGGRHVGFCVNGTPTFPEPYASLTPKPCSFCGGGDTDENRRGAVVFRAEGGARFVDNENNPIAPLPGPAGNSATIALCSTDSTQQQNYLMAISGLTGFVGIYKK